MGVPQGSCPGYSLERETRRESGEEKREFEELLYYAVKRDLEELNDG